MSSSAVRRVGGRGPRSKTAPSLVLVFAFAFIAIAAACGGGASPPADGPAATPTAVTPTATPAATPTAVAPAPTATPAAASQAKVAKRTGPIRILTLGDSYTFGELVGKLENWPVQLVRKLRVAGQGTAGPIAVAGSGWDTSDLAGAIRFDGPQGPFDLVTLLIGVNNHFGNGTAAEFGAGLLPLIDTAIGLADGDVGRVILISIPDWGATPYAEGAPRTEITRAINEFNGIVSSRAREAGVRFVDITVISRRALDDPGLVAEDGLHPSGQLYAEWVEVIYPVAAELLDIVE